MSEVETFWVNKEKCRNSHQFCYRYMPLALGKITIEELKNKKRFKLKFAPSMSDADKKRIEKRWLYKTINA